MPSEVRHLVDGGQPYPVVRLTGVLDAATAPEVRSALLDVLAGQPEAVVVDVRELAVGRPGRRRRAARRRPRRPPTGRPPTCVLCATGDGDRRLARRPAWPVWPRPRRGVRRAGRARPRPPAEPRPGAGGRRRPPLPRAGHRGVRPVGPARAGRPGLHRGHRDGQQRGGARAHPDDGAAGRARRRDDAWRSATSSPTVPRFTGGPVAATSYGGRGLLLIDSVAQPLGQPVLDDGKVVWALLRPATRRAARRPTAPAQA